MSNRADARALIAADLGGAAGTIVSGTATSAVLGGLVNVNRNVDARRNALLVFPGSSDADLHRVISEWTPELGRAAWASTPSVADPSADPFELYPAGFTTVDEVNAAINDVLRIQRRPVENALATRRALAGYVQIAWPWLRSKQDIEAVEVRLSPCLLDNEELEQWREGPAAAPTSWVLSGSVTTIARSTDSVRGRYSAAVTRAGTLARMTQSVGTLDGYLRQKTIVARLEGTTSTASALRVGVYDGVDTTYSDYHTGGGALEALTVEHIMNAAATRCDVFVEIATVASATVERVIAAEARLPEQLIDYGSASYRRRPLRHVKRDVAGAVVIEPEEGLSAGRQYVITTMQPYPPIANDTDELDCDVTLARHGAVAILASTTRQGDDRPYLDRKARDAAVLAADIARVIATRPTAPPVSVPRIVQGA